RGRYCIERVARGDWSGRRDLPPQLTGCSDCRGGGHCGRFRDFQQGRRRDGGCSGAQENCQLSRPRRGNCLTRFPAWFSEVMGGTVMVSKVGYGFLLVLLGTWGCGQKGAKRQ